MDETVDKIAKDSLIAVLRALSQGVLIVNKEYRIIFGNQAFAKHLGLTENDLIGRCCFEVCKHRTVPCAELGERCSAKQVFESGSIVTRVHTHFTVAESAVELEMTSYPAKNEQGEVVAVVDIASNISEQFHLRQEDVHAQKMEAIGRLAGGIAHDFNNLLAVIMGMAEVLLQGEDKSSDWRHSANVILEAATRAGKLTQDLLAFSRSQPPQVQPVKINAIVTAAASILRRVIGENISFSVDLSAGDDTVKANDGQLEQVLMNLVINARDAMPHGGSITIGTGRAAMDQQSISRLGFGSLGDYATITVSDTGSGMDNATMARIFEPFFTTKKLGRGTGLGLAMTYRIVKQHGGFIAVQSETGVGTTFTIYLPLVKAPIVSPKPIEEEKFNGNGELILVAEDEESVRGITQQILERAGYRTLLAANGTEAVEQFSQHQQDVSLLLLDMIMPGKDGIEVFEAARRLRSDIPVVFASGYGDGVLRERGVVPKEVRIVDKPFLRRQLLRAVHETLHPKEGKA
ncbi:response regulator [Patescibacteria group bacterium]|nr:MAG: response regulator [Patescibacteria group bacterium]